MTDYSLGDNPKLIGYWPLNDEAESPTYGIAYMDGDLEQRRDVEESRGACDGWCGDTTGGFTVTADNLTRYWDGEDSGYSYYACICGWQSKGLPLDHERFLVVMETVATHTCNEESAKEPVGDGGVIPPRGEYV